MFTCIILRPRISEAQLKCYFYYLKHIRGTSEKYDTSAVRRQINTNEIEGRQYRYEYLGLHLDQSYAANSAGVIAVLEKEEEDQRVYSSFQWLLLESPPFI